MQYSKYITLFENLIFFSFKNGHFKKYASSSISCILNRLIQMCNDRTIHLILISSGLSYFYNQDNLKVLLFIRTCAWQKYAGTLLPYLIMSIHTSEPLEIHVTIKVYVKIAFLRYSQVKFNWIALLKNCGKCFPHFALYTQPKQIYLTDSSWWI